MFCVADESVDHLFLHCPLARLVWGVFQVGFDAGQAPMSLHNLGDWIRQFQCLDLTIVKIFLAAIFWTLWKTRNRACFDHVLPFDPVGVIYHICHWLDFWSDLQKPKVARALRQGARRLMAVAGANFISFSHASVQTSFLSLMHRFIILEDQKLGKQTQDFLHRLIYMYRSKLV